MVFHLKEKEKEEERITSSNTPTQRGIGRNRKNSRGNAYTCTKYRALYFQSLRFQVYLPYLSLTMTSENKRSLLFQSLRKKS